MMNDSEAFLTFWQNTSLSVHDNQTEREFPQWKPVVSLLLLGIWVLLVSLTIPLSISVVLAAVRSSHNKKFTLIHGYVLVVNILARVFMAFTLSNFIPPAIRFCECSTATSAISLYLQLFTTGYQPYMLAGLAVFQLLIIKGKKKFVNYKVVGITLFMTTVLTIVLPIIFIGVATNGSGGTVICDSTIGCAGIDAARLLSIFVAFHASVWIPSVSILLTATIWSCAIFKKNYTGDDNGLNRRIVAMPLLMPVIVSLISIATFASYRVADIITIQTLLSNSFSRNWNASFKFIVVLMNEAASGLSYPGLVLFLNPKLWESWKKTALLWKKNRVTPEQSNQS